MTQNNDGSVERANEIFAKFKQEHRHVTGGLQCYSELNEVEKQAAFKGIEFTVKHLMSQNEHQPKQIPDGWKLVPIEPTPEMLEKIWQLSRSNDFTEDAYEGVIKQKASIDYKAMIKAAPTNTEVGE